MSTDSNETDANKILTELTKQVEESNISQSSKKAVTQKDGYDEYYDVNKEQPDDENHEHDHPEDYY